MFLILGSCVKVRLDVVLFFPILESIMSLFLLD